MASLVAGRAIREMRRDLGVTQSELAKRLGTSAPYVSALETGRANPTVGQLWAVANALGVELHLSFRQPASRSLPQIPAPPTPRRPLSHRAAREREIAAR